MIDTIINDKWENAMPLIPDNSVDLIITSPPYNVSLGDNKFRDSDKGYDSYEDNMPYNDYLDWMDKLFKECYRVLRPGGRICVNIGDGSNGKIPTHADFTVRMRDKHNFLMMTTIIWNKGQIGSRLAWGSWKSPSQPSFPTPFEFIIVMAKETLKHEGSKDKISITAEDFKANSVALWTFPPDTRMMKKFNHPATFPEELPKRLIQHLSYENDVILDPFSGAGTTCYTAKSLNRHYIGIEMSKNYYDTSISRLEGTPISFTNKVTNQTTIPDWELEIETEP